MEIEYTDKMVKWIYNNNKITYEANGIEFASYNSGIVYIEMVNDDIYEYRFVDLKGEDICKYNENNLLTIFKNVDKHEIKLEEINDILVFDGKIYVMNKRKDIIIFNEDGENNGVIKPPQGYIFSRFCNNSKFEVICEADLLNADSFGRVDYKFEYDLFCNNWERKTVVY